MIAAFLLPLFRGFLLSLLHCVFLRVGGLRVLLSALSRFFLLHHKLLLSRGEFRSSRRTCGEVIGEGRTLPCRTRPYAPPAPKSRLRGESLGVEQSRNPDLVQQPWPSRQRTESEFLLHRHGSRRPVFVESSPSPSRRLKTVSGLPRWKRRPGSCDRSHPAASWLASRTKLPRACRCPDQTGLGRPRLFRRRISRPAHPPSDPP